MTRLLLGASVVVALAVPALAQDEDSMGMMGPPPAEAAPTASASATAAPVAAVAELPPLTHDLDAIFARAWKEAGVLPAPDAAPGELVRRVYLDLAGRTPTVDEAKEFVASTDPAKLPKTIDKILASHEFAEHMATGLTVVLLGREAQFEALTRNQFRDWLASRLDADAPLDAIAREILGAKADSVVKDPAAQYLMLFGGDPAVIAGRTARIFLGNRIACAQCHDHPYERWKRTDFWSLAAYFQRVRREPVYEPLTEEMKKKKIQQRVIDWKVFEGDGGDTYIPLQNGETGRPALALPRFLGGTYDVMLYGTRQPRLPSLATAVTVEKRHDLARALSNRFFAQLFGRGIVHPVDDFTETHPTTLPEALERITTGFEETGLRLKGYLRALALTQAYGRTSMGQPAASDANVPEKIDARDKAQWTKKAAAEDPALEYFARMRHKPLSPEQALHAFATASGSEEAARAGGEAAVKSWKQTESGLQNQFIQLMSRHDEEDPHSIQEGIPQALVLMNGPGVAYFCQALPNTTVGRAAQEKDVRARIDGLYLAAFARAPSARELGDALAFFDKKDATKATEDYYWSLVNSSEFLYNH